MKKLPYIPDKSLYAAVMFACKMIRENGYFNKDCEIAANYYDVDVEKVKRYVRMAQGRGQKQANKRKPKTKFKWYVIYYVPDFEAEDDCGTCTSWDLSIQDLLDKTEIDLKRATSFDNVMRSIHKSSSNTPYYGTHFKNSFKIFEFDTKKQAEQFISETSDEQITEWIKERWPNNHYNNKPKCSPEETDLFFKNLKSKLQQNLKSEGFKDD